MLTATYSMVALTTEQKNALSILEQLQRYIRSVVKDLQSVNRACVESALLRLEQFEDFCHQRKVELYVIPAIRKTTHEADPILSELEALQEAGIRILGSLKQQLRAAVEQGISDIKEIFRAMEQYCLNLWKRLKMEEEELLPIVRGLLPVEEWFNIASKLLSEDAQGKRKSGKPAPAVLAA